MLECISVWFKVKRELLSYSSSLGKRLHSWSDTICIHYLSLYKLSFANGFWETGCGNQFCFFKFMSVSKFVLLPPPAHFLHTPLGHVDWGAPQRQYFTWQQSTLGQSFPLGPKVSHCSKIPNRPEVSHCSNRGAVGLFERRGVRHFWLLSPKNFCRSISFR